MPAFVAESREIWRNNAKRGGSGPNRLPASACGAVRFRATSFARIRAQQCEAVRFLEFDRIWF
jgi:hypothetical protein